MRPFKGATGLLLEDSGLSLPTPPRLRPTPESVTSRPGCLSPTNAPATHLPPHRDHLQRKSRPPRPF